MRSKRVWRLSFLLLIVVIVYGAYSLILNSLEGAEVQSKGEGKQELQIKGMPPEEMRYNREKLEKEIGELENDTKILSDKMWFLDDMKKLEKQLVDAQQRKDRQEIERIKDGIKRDQKDADTKDSWDQVNEKIQNNKKLLKEKRDLKYRLETALFSDVQQKNSETQFRVDISRYFTGLIAAVILGFFVVAFRDQIVRREIFSGHSGIQFITLFSLVIAIILFGIMGILEGKELAALLGGLSGYILGRTTSAKTEPAQPKTPLLSSPAITSISPVEATVGAPPVPVQIVGNGLQLANSVKIIQGANEVLVSDITSNDQVISCKVTLNANQPKGSYDVIVTNSDGAVAKLPQAFTVK